MALRANLNVGNIMISPQTQYTIQAYLGGGGFGRAYKTQTTQGVTRVVKLRLDESEYGSQGFDLCRRTFETEFTLMQSMNHPQIPKVFEMFGYTLPVSVGGGTTEAFSMEFLEGANLFTIVLDDTDTTGAYDPNVSVQQIVQYLISGLEPLHYIHQLNIVWRDGKPENMIISPQGIAKIYDFGASTYIRDPQRTRRTTGITITDAYVSPSIVLGGRQRRSNQTDDVYSVGAIAYNLLTKIEPNPLSNPDRELYPANPGTALHNILTGPTLLKAGDVQRHNSDVDANLESIMFSAMRKEEGDRYQSALEFQQELEQWLQRQQPATTIPPQHGRRPQPLPPLTPPRLVATLQTSTNRITFPATLVGTRPNPQQTFTISNTGNVALRIADIRSDNAMFTVAPTSGTVAPNAPGGLSVTVTFVPGGTIAGPQVGTITIVSNDPGSPHTIAVSGDVVVPVPKLEYQGQSPLDLGKSQLGSIGGTVLIQFKNTGNGNLVVQALQMSKGDFIVTPAAGQPVATVPQNKTLDVTIQFSPQTMGKISGTLTVVSNDPSGNFDLDLEGEGEMAQAPDVKAVVPSSGYLGQTGLTVRVIGDHLPTDPAAVAVDFGPGVTVVSVTPRSQNVLEVTVDIATAILGAYTSQTSQKNDVTIVNSSGAVSGKLASAFTVTQAPPRMPVITQLNTGQLYPGAKAAFSLVGTFFQKDGTNIPAVSCTAPGVQFNDVVLGGANSLSGTIRIPSSCPTGTYDIHISNPDGKSAVGRGLLIIEAPFQGQRVCPHCHRQTDAAKDRCELCLLHKSAPIRSARG